MRNRLRTLVGDILFQGDRILEVASSIDDPGAEVIDISGLTFLPILDAHSHNDWFVIARAATYEPFMVWVTSFITGTAPSRRI